MEGSTSIALAADDVVDFVGGDCAVGTDHAGCDTEGAVAEDEALVTDISWIQKT